MKMPKTPPNDGKPAMERKRRARINESLSQLKLFIMEDLVDHFGRLSRIDKAEILQTTVRHLSEAKHNQYHKGTVSSAAYHAGVNDCVLSVHHIISSDYNIDPETRIKLLDHISSWLYHNFDSQLPGHVMDLSAGSAPRSPLHQSRVEKHDPETTRTISSAITSPREITLSAPFTQSHPREHVTSTYANRGVQRQKSTQAVVEQLQHDSLRPREISSPLRDISNIIKKSHT